MFSAKTAFAVVSLAGASAALAGPLIASFSYEVLDSSYDANSGSLVTASTTASTGSVSRLAAPMGSAAFGVGSASFLLDLQVTNVSGHTADGVGTVIATDLNGDTMTADVSGTFTYMPVTGPVGIIFYDGVLSHLFFNDISGDGEFNGDSTFFSTDFSSVAPQPFYGGLQRLQISDVDFFDTSWASELAEVDGQVVPAPAALATLGLASIVAGRRRQR